LEFVAECGSIISQVKSVKDSSKEEMYICLAKSTMIFERERVYDIKGANACAA